MRKILVVLVSCLIFGTILVLITISTYRIGLLNSFFPSYPGIQRVYELSDNYPSLVNKNNIKTQAIFIGRLQDKQDNYFTITNGTETLTLHNEVQFAPGESIRVFNSGPGIVGTQEINLSQLQIDDVVSIITVVDPQTAKLKITTISKLNSLGQSINRSNANQNR